jgi:DNA-binding FrmR family transcriptional regulator
MNRRAIDATLPIFDQQRTEQLQARLNRIEGQVRGVSRMLGEQRPCLEVLQQLASVQSALRGVTKEVLRNYLERCATEAIRSGDSAIYDELMEAIYKYAK